VLWTIGLQVADASTCAPHPDLTVEFVTDLLPHSRQVLSFAPVACIEGEFTVDRLPLSFWIAGVKNSEAGMDVPLDASGTAFVDLPY
jgi:hypothetical protein